MSDQHVQSVAGQKSSQISQEQRILIASMASKPKVELEQFSIYEADQKEVLWMEDGICEQKTNRDKKAKAKKERTITDVIILQKPNSCFEKIVSSENVSLTALVEVKFKAYYSG